MRHLTQQSECLSGVTEYEQLVVCAATSWNKHPPNGSTGASANLPGLSARCGSPGPCSRSLRLLLFRFSHCPPYSINLEPPGVLSFSKGGNSLSRCCAASCRSDLRSLLPTSCFVPLHLFLSPGSPLPAIASERAGLEAPTPKRPSLSNLSPR